MSAATAEKFAKILKSLQQRSHKPLVLTNVYDILSARTIAELPSSEALATASYGVAREIGTDDDSLTLEGNLSVVKGISAVAKEYNKPLTVDLQDGYGTELEDAVGQLLDLGVAGINLEDNDRTTGALFDIDAAASRVKQVLEIAKKRNAPNFVVNARTDVLPTGGEFDEVLKRGKKYLEAGATSVFVWGASKGVSKAEVVKMVEEFDGRLNVYLKFSPDGLTIKQLAEIGVARISIGPTLQFKAMAALKAEAEKLLTAV